MKGNENEVENTAAAAGLGNYRWGRSELIERNTGTVANFDSVTDQEKNALNPQPARSRGKDDHKLPSQGMRPTDIRYPAIARIQERTLEIANSGSTVRTHVRYCSAAALG